MCVCVFVWGSVCVCVCVRVCVWERVCVHAGFMVAPVGRRWWQECSARWEGYLLDVFRLLSVRLYCCSSQRKSRGEAIISQLSPTRLISHHSLPRALIYGRVNFFSLFSLFWATNSLFFPSSTSGQRGIITSFPQWQSGLVCVCVCVCLRERDRVEDREWLLFNSQDKVVTFFFPAPPGKTQSWWSEEEK